MSCDSKTKQKQYCVWYHKDKVPIIMFVFCLDRSLDFVYSVYATIEEMHTCSLSKEIIIARANFVLAKG